jgi:Caspase domain
VAWTPSGYYMASPGGEDLIGWHVNRGWNQAADFFPGSRFRDRFNRSDIVSLVLATLDEDEAIKQANDAARRHADTSPLIAHLPPVVTISSPAADVHVQNGTLTINYAVRSPSGQPIDRIDLLIDGRPAKVFGLAVHAGLPNAETTGSIPVTLTEHVTEVGLQAWSGKLASQPMQVKITWDAAPAVTRKLYALVIGVSNYADPAMTLKFAAKDASDFAAALAHQKGHYYADVETRVITDRDVTQQSVLEGLQWLEGVATNPNDVSVLFIAGHGMTDEKQTYWFYTSDSNDNNVLNNGVSQDKIRKSLQHLSGKVLWFLDTCHAGAAANRQPVNISVLVNTASASENGGVVVFASSTGKQVSVESTDLGNGAFTKAVVEGIEMGKAAPYGDLVTTSSLDGYVRFRVDQITHGAQTPVMERPPQEPDFPIAEVRK